MNDAFDTRAATICTFYPEDAAGAITDRTTLKSLQSGGISFTDAEEWANNAMYRNNAPLSPLGQPDNDVMMKFLAAKAARHAPGVEPPQSGANEC